MINKIAARVQNSPPWSPKACIYPVAAEAWSSGQGDIADVGRGRGRDRLVDDQGPVLEARAPGRLHLPELL